MNAHTDEIENRISERVIMELHNKNIKQSQLLRSCSAMGINISQASISKIYAAKKKLNLLELAAISKIVGKSIDYFVWGEEHGEDFCNPHDPQTLHAFGEEIKPYRGVFHIYFLATAETEEKILHGTLHVKEEESFYSLKLKLYTGEKDINKQQIIKEYDGRILVSTSLGGAYLIFKSEEIGEMCMICLRHRNYTVKSVECRVGIALTMSAGELKEPVAHRCLLTRTELDKEKIGQLQPWLCMINEIVRIEKSRAERLIKELEERYPEHREEIGLIAKTAAHREYLEFDVSMLRRWLSIGRQEMLKVLTEFYNRADKPKNYMVSSADDIRMYELITEIGKMKTSESAGS